MSKAWLETLFEWSAIRWLAAAACLARGAFWWALGRRYRAFSDLCWVARASRSPFLQARAEGVVLSVIEHARRTGHNPISDWYRADRAAAACANIYKQGGRGSADLLRDLIVLKAATKDEKGVVLLKYVRTFHAVVALLDVERLMERYVFVLEPCWTGYCDPGVLMLFRPGQPALVQCFFEEDYQFITRVGPPFVPVRLGPADWVDADAFDIAPAADKAYDLVMVANWAKHKRHALLFRALGELRDRKLRVLLVGFPWAGRTAENIRAEARRLCGSSATIDIREAIPHRELANLLVQCKVFVFLSKKEGDNKALVEAMFANVPAIVYERTIGGALSRVNAETGMLSSEIDLPAKIRYMLDCYALFAPRRWALEHTGSRVATRVLDAALQRIASSEGRVYSTGIVEKCNSPNLAYKRQADRLCFQADYEFVLSCRRDASTGPQTTKCGGAGQTSS